MKTTTAQNALTMLKKDHDKVKGLFEKFEKARGEQKKKALAEEAIRELKVHATLEEEIFYPAVRNALKAKDLLDEATEEHHVAKVLIAELTSLPLEIERYEAKFTVLAENVRHHIKEEEGEMFPQARKSRIDLKEIGDLMANRKEALLRDGVAPGPEDRMIQQSGAVA